MTARHGRFYRSVGAWAYLSEGTAALVADGVVLTPSLVTLPGHTQEGCNGCFLVSALSTLARLVCVGRVALLARVHSLARERCFEQVSHQTTIASLVSLPFGMKRKEEVCCCHTCVARHTCDARFMLACFQVHSKFLSLTSPTCTLVMLDKCASAVTWYMYFSLHCLVFRACKPKQIGGCNGACTRNAGQGVGGCSGAT